MEQGYTITPTTTETTEGDVVTDFEIEGMQEGYDSFDPNFHGYDYHVDKYGRAHHDYENVHFEEYDEDPELEFNHDGFFVSNLMELAGGVESYQETINWARRNLSEEQQLNFNAAMDSHDDETIEAAVIELMHAQQESNSPQEVVSDSPEDQMFEEDANDIFDELGGRHVYEHITEWARNEMPDDQIDRFNYLMSHGSKHEVRVGVQWLTDKYREANTRG